MSEPSVTPAGEPRRTDGWKRAIPWQAKLSAKLIGGAVPAVAGLIRRMGGYDHGPMDDVQYVTYWIDEHMRRCSLASLEGRAILELGPGDAITSALVAAGRGARSITLVDESDFATRDVELYREVAARLARHGLDVPDLRRAKDRHDVLERCRAQYLTGGLASLEMLPATSFDASWSQAVLEHVRLDEFEDMLVALRRLHRLGTPTSHRVDLQDHLARSIHTLTLPDRLWERPLVWRSGAYTNRLRASGIIDAFGRAGFAVTEVGRRVWPEPPVPRRRLRPPFRELADEDLCCAEIDLVAVRRD